jgi:hypothetical protein
MRDKTAVEVLAAALCDLLDEQFCPSTSGGTGGKWCLNHDDQPMVDDDQCYLIARCREALNAAGHLSVPAKSGSMSSPRHEPAMEGVADMRQSG